MPYGSVSTPWWGEVWIVGGGPSASAFDFRALGETVLAVNDALFRFSSASSFAVTAFSVDNAWVRRHRDFLEAWRGEKYFAVPLETWPDCDGIPGATYLRRNGLTGLSEDPGALRTGGNSGYAAINLAVLKRAREIHLVGFDMRGGAAKFRQWIPRFRTMVPRLSERGVRVFNHGASAIDAFEKVET